MLGTDCLADTPNLAEIRLFRLKAHKLYFSELKKLTKLILAF